MITANWAELPFEQRQSLWEGEPRTFRQNNGRGERPTVWDIRVQGDRIFTSHGLLGGARQETNKTGKAKNIGRANAITAEQDAIAEARRIVRKKYDFEGYDEYLGDFNIDSRNTETPVVSHLLTNLPSSFSLYKPDNTVANKKLLEKIASGRATYTLKVNGHAFLVVVDAYGQIKIYSRRVRAWHDEEGPTERSNGTLDYSTVIPWNVRLAHLVEEIKLLNLPPSTMMAVELYHGANSKKSFKYTGEVLKSLTPRALAMQQEKGFIQAYWWDLPFYAGNDLVSRETVGFRYSLITQIWDKYVWSTPGQDRPIQPIYRFHDIAFPQFRDMEKAKAYALEHGYEGYVVVDEEGVYGDKGWNLKGKPDRPAAFCGKVKPWLEDDFVVQWNPAMKWGTFGKGRHEKGKIVTLPDGRQVEHGGVGSVGLFQYNKAGELVYICDCSSGMPYEFQAQLRPESFWQVWEIQFTERSYVSEGDDSNALIFPKFIRQRPDKLPQECINERL